MLLDTHALIWLVAEEPMTPESVAAVRDAAVAGEALVSPVSAWEVGLLAARRKAGLSFLPTPRDWFAQALRVPGIRLTALTPEAAIDAAFLPGSLHRDPADRLLIATARQLKVPIVTRDRMILDYAAQGHVEAIAC